MPEAGDPYAAHIARYQEAQTLYHSGRDDELHAARQKTLDQAFSANPNRFVNKTPEPPAKPTAVWINPPKQKLLIQA